MDELAGRVERAGTSTLLSLYRVTPSPSSLLCIGLETSKLKKSRNVLRVKRKGGEDVSILSKSGVSTHVLEVCGGSGRAAVIGQDGCTRRNKAGPGGRGLRMRTAMTVGCIKYLPQGICPGAACIHRTSEYPLIPSKGYRMHRCCN